MISEVILNRSQGLIGEAHDDDDISQFDDGCVLVLIVA
jgi:hypothetical protein